jgi:hypothetical protein
MDATASTTDEDTDATKSPDRAVPLLGVGARRRRRRGAARSARRAAAATRSTSTPGAGCPTSSSTRTSANGRWPPRRGASASCATPNTDAYEVLESDMDELVRARRRGRRARRRARRQGLVEAPAGGDGRGREREEFKHVERDRERLAELRALDPDERPKDELRGARPPPGPLQRARRRAPRRARRAGARAFEMSSRASSSSQIREERITAEASQAFMDTYSKWEWLAGTYRSEDPINRQRSFAAHRASSPRPRPRCSTRCAPRSPSSRRRCSGEPRETEYGRCVG